jgi:ADP-ribosylglycohydrolase
MSDALLDKVYGCLIGGAIGDAMGAAAEDWHYTDIRSHFGRITTFLPQPARSRDGAPGQITDDTTLRHYMCLAIIRKGGRITPDDYAKVWLSDLIPARLFFTERIVVEKLKLGMNPWETGRGQPRADAAIMAVAPIGIINAGNPAQRFRTVSTYPRSTRMVSNATRRRLRRPDSRQRSARTRHLNACSTRCTNMVASTPVG